ncbi:DUF3060 domain-containing protein [Mycolicibacillus parakoreensis]|uniref:DUF3060 domain-containing protein n=1 Tax=Mycolicibacillus parakoreensis TaxID=1069221 RepID=A0ABY3TWZ0_9MYCO|nr:DUF3060 domain-containing protein [Mycolicibacillus parakoreensis]MCV7315352.1 DUF3060 domain-containing protein [Mycolicibacillus parakoreensis]ULN52175.1 DUF3060 domain-containing protein [Mycolicibacillus parakoreensis]
MRRRHRAPVALAAFLLAGLPAGCGSGHEDADSSPTAQVQVGDTVNYGSVGTTAELDCGDGKSLNVGGSNNTLTVTGTCRSVKIGGTDNKITVERIDADLSIVGFNNTVTYRQGDPAVSDLGSENIINRG